MINSVLLFSRDIRTKNNIIRSFDKNNYIILMIEITLQCKRVS